MSVDHGEETIGVSELLQYGDKLRCAGRDFLLEEIGSMAVVQTHLLLLTYRGEYYELRSDSGA